MRSSPSRPAASTGSSGGPVTAEDDGDSLGPPPTAEEIAALWSPPSPAALAEVARIAAEVKSFCDGPHALYTQELYEAIMPELDPADESIWVWPLPTRDPETWQMLYGVRASRQ
jgi:hypothetical protein